MILMLENPTLEQRKLYTYIVYLITNLLNGKNYVGETKQSFFKRYCAKKWWTQIDNKELNRDILKLEIENFKITILENNVYDVIERKCLEDDYAIKYNAYYPIGYNIAQCGLKADYREAMNRGIEKLREAMRTIKVKEFYEFIDPEGNKIIIKDLWEFCKINKLHYYNMIKVDNGKQNHAHGYSNPKNPIKIYEFVSPNDVIYKVRSEKICEFSLSQGLRQSDLCFLTREQCKIYNGWRLLKNRHISPIKKIYKLRSPLGHIYHFENAAEFCRQHNLDNSNLNDVLKGNIIQHRSWSLDTIELEIFWIKDSKNNLYR